MSDFHQCPNCGIHKLKTVECIICTKAFKKKRTRTTYFRKAKRDAKQGKKMRKMRRRDSEQ